MNIYYIESEEVGEVEIIVDGQGPLKYFRIVELVVAPTRDRAKQLALADYLRKHAYSLCESPSVRSRKLGVVEGSEGIVSNNPRYWYLWGHPKIDHPLHEVS